ncbi:hypothetical protein B0I35DRAFT_136264 [Stachybotrys elegans]|uniref:DUF2406 domain-containing protein n=1 Tax=Stachybotrys elegans TaxID=80388 RepID=A0A8K0SZA3_9HYPO|nr:hypothetical protein B0I35DRAFT_136264 [Stachybotrys elegans]
MTATVAAMKTEASFAPLRSLQHRDSTGNVISEPDKSNPTRHRWERPLDTIRSFEAAIDGGYARKSMYRADTDSAVNSNRRSSFHPGSQSRVWQQDGYNNSNYNVSSRPVSMRHDHNNHGNSRHSYYEGQGYNGGYGPPPVPRQRASRQYSEPHFQNYRREQNVYPLPHKDRSYETVTSAAGSGNSDNAGYQTDPTSSDNSSIERASPPKRVEPVNDYGISFNPANAKQAQNFSVTLPANRSNPLPPLPQGTDQKMAAQPIQRKMVKRQPSAAVAPAAPTNEKRKSWFSRRFSKQ